MTTIELDPRAIGRAIRHLRRTVGWTQAELARRSGSSQAAISDIERGRTGQLACRTAARTLEALGARVLLAVDAPFLADREHQRDAAHARCVAYTAGRLERAGWDVATEVAIGRDRPRGWIDVMGHHPQTGLVLVVEIKTELHDLGAVDRQLQRYEGAAWGAARERGWRPRAVAGALLALATDAVDERARANRELLRRSFPGRAVDLDRVVRSGRLPRDGRRFMALIDPLSRRSVWLRPLRVDGRRAAARYADYASFIRARADRSRAPRHGRPPGGTAGRARD